MIDYKRDLLAAAHRWYDPRARRRRRVRRAAVPLAAMAVVVAIVAGVSVGQDGAREIVASPPVQLTGKLAPVGDLEPVFGQPAHTVGGFSGRPTLFVFGSSTCSTCVKDLPAIAHAKASVEDAGGSLVYVDTGESEQTIRSTGAPAPLRDSVFADPDGSYARQWHVRSLPSAAFADRRGLVTAVRSGAFSPAWLARLLPPPTRRDYALERRIIASFAALRDRDNIVDRLPDRLDATGRFPGGQTHLVFDGPVYRMWVTISPVQQSVQVLDRGGGGGGGSGPLSLAFAREGTFGYSAGGLLQAFVPDGTHGASAQMRDGSVVALVVRGNTILQQFRRLPTRVWWFNAQGHRYEHELNGFEGDKVDTGPGPPHRP